ncbi:peptidase M4 [Terrilactibacillus sp. S3-3]|nr:peptidase M4 [Terrilactibacillus sp. S3-3]
MQARHHFHATNVRAVNYYYGKEAYHVLRGRAGGHAVYLWIPDNKKKGTYIERRVNAGITKQKALQVFEGLHLDVSKVVSVKLGVNDNAPTWEITFLDAKQRYNYVSIYFDNGKEAERILHI